MLITKKCQFCKKAVDIRLLRGVIFSKKLPADTVQLDGIVIKADSFYEKQLVICKNCLFTQQYRGGR
jgi:hypothetical protein